MNGDGWLYAWNDGNDSWFGDDKLAHLFGGAVVWVLGAVHVGPWWAFAIAAGAGLAIELLETVRYQRWGAKGYSRPWPWLTDKISLKDLLADLAGALGMWAAIGSRIGCG